MMIFSATLESLRMLQGELYGGLLWTDKSFQLSHHFSPKYEHKESHVESSEESFHRGNNMTSTQRMNVPVPQGGKRDYRIIDALNLPLFS